MNTIHEVFLSTVIVVHNQRANIREYLKTANDVVKNCVSDHEIIIIDNGSTDGSVELLRSLCGEQGIPDLQVYRLANEVEKDIAAWAGIDNALGDYVAVLDPTINDIHALPELLAASVNGADVVLGITRTPPRRLLVNRLAGFIFDNMIKHLLRIDTSRDMPFFRILSRKVVNFMLQHPAAGLSYRWLPATSGFLKATVTYDGLIQSPHQGLLDDIDRGIRLLVSSSFGPMRVVTFLSLFGAGMNLLYSVYVIAVAIFKEEIEPGWITLSLQQSGMFFLFSLVFLVLGEYVLHMAKLAANAPNYYVSDEFTSAVITRRERLNVEISSARRSTGTLNDSTSASGSTEP